ncbi:Uncharacterised protein [Salmonella enterica]|nr:Uncharacterised protein [Salmonella enterica]
MANNNGQISDELWEKCVLLFLSIQPITRWAGTVSEWIQCNPLY